MKLTTTAGLALALTAAITMGRSYFRGPSTIYSVHNMKGSTTGHKMYILITGGTKGIGKQLVQKLAGPYTEIIFTGRSQSTLQALELKRSIESQIPNSTIHFYPVDFSSLSQVKKFSQDVNQKFPNLDI
jgi:short-subunit dehydrogenase involved in D-alanine esterification of teichoic acids